MTSWEWRRSAAYSVLLLEVAEKHGLTPAECLRGTGIEANQLITQGAEVTAAQELSLIRNIVTPLGDPVGLGVEVGLSTRVTTCGVFALAVLSSPTIRSALEVSMRYYGLMGSYTRVSYEFRDDKFWMYTYDEDVPADLRGFLLERDLSGWLLNWNLATGVPPVVLHGEVAGGLYSRMKPILDMFDITTVVPSERNSPHLTVYDATGFNEPMPQASPLTAMLFEEQCVDLLQRRGLERGVAGTVREALLHRMNGRITQEEVAGALNMSLRTMRRRLAEEGTSYRKVCVETYGTLAEELLATGLTVEDVAYRMGYSGAPSFSSAFKQWRGISPGRFARSNSERLRHGISG